MFNIFLGSQPQKFLRKTDKELRKRIWKMLDELKNNPFPQEIERVQGKKSKSFRVRVGDYRIQYEVDQSKKEILVFNIDKRSRAYN